MVYIAVYWCLMVNAGLYTGVWWCILGYGGVCKYTMGYTGVYRCMLVFAGVCNYIILFITIYSCLLVHADLYTGVYWCIVFVGWCMQGLIMVNTGVFRSMLVHGGVF